MNAISLTPAAATPRASSPAQKMQWLLKREFWENKGGFFWAPVITAAIFTLFMLVAVAIGTALHNGQTSNIESHDPAEIARAAGAAGDISLLVGIGITSAILGFVLFFYALGSLYDDRRDRSILFWKSMPISDTMTVLSKLAWLLVLAPVIALAVGAALGLVMWVVGAVTTTINGVPGGPQIFTHSHPFRILGNLIAMLPVQALWSLPAVGWLMLCSATARSKPFLWAVLLPFVGCALLSMVSGIARLNLPLDKLWYVVMYRGLGSIVPGSWAPVVIDSSNPAAIRNPEDIVSVISASHYASALGSLDLWLGVAAGVAMIAAAIRLRRWRDEG